MRIAIYIMLLNAVFTAAKAQDLESYLQSVEQHNPRLIALQKWISAEQTYARTGIYPDNPELSYNYLFGSPEVIGDQQELEITQSFKLPGYYTSKLALQQLELQQKEALVEKERREVLHTARSAWFKMSHLIKKEEYLQNRKSEAAQYITNIKVAFESGEISKATYYKAQIYAVGAETNWKKTRSEIKIHKQYLTQLNGGKTLTDVGNSYPLDWKLPVLDSLLALVNINNPDLIMAQLSVEQANKEIKHERMNGLPAFEAGYKSEKVLDQKLQGFHAGISVPLWQNKNKVKHAQLQSEYSQANLTQKIAEVENKAKVLFYSAQTAKESYLQIRGIIKDDSLLNTSVELLQSGQISFSEYILETEMVTETYFTFLDYQFNYYEKLSELKLLIE